MKTDEIQYLPGPVNRKPINGETARLMALNNAADFERSLKQRDAAFVLLFIFATLLAALLFVLIRGNS